MFCAVLLSYETSTAPFSRYLQEVVNHFQELIMLRRSGRGLKAIEVQWKNKHKTMLLKWMLIQKHKDIGVFRRHNCCPCLLNSNEGCDVNRHDSLSVGQICWLLSAKESSFIGSLLDNVGDYAKAFFLISISSKYRKHVAEAEHEELSNHFISSISKNKLHWISIWLVPTILFTKRVCSWYSGKARLKAIFLGYYGYDQNTHRFISANCRVRSYLNPSLPSASCVRWNLTE